jgi:hypothetical protein
MFNTTTIPTQMETKNNFFCLFSVLSSGMLLGCLMMELFMYRLREKERLYESEYEDSEEDDTEEDDTEENYTDKYYEEFEALAMRELTAAELLDLNKKIVREQIAENVEVILTFDKETDTFWYYTNQLKEVSYDILETVARKFAIEYDCKQICLQAAEEEPKQAQEESKQAQEESKQAQEESKQAQEEPVGKPSVFAKFKNYNTGGKGSTPNFTSVVKVIEQMNHFRYRGKILDYEETQKELTKKEDPTLDYASYKKTLCEKKEN